MKLSHNPPHRQRWNSAADFGADVWSSVTGNTGPVVLNPCAGVTRSPDPPLFATPEPASLVLLGSGLLAATRGLRRFKS